MAIRGTQLRHGLQKAFFDEVPGERVCVCARHTLVHVTRTHTHTRSSAPACSHTPPAPTPAHMHSNTVIPLLCAPTPLHAASDIVFTTLRGAQALPAHPSSPGLRTGGTVSGLSTPNTEHDLGTRLTLELAEDSQKETLCPDSHSEVQTHWAGPHAGLVQVPAVEAAQGEKGGA